MKSLLPKLISPSQASFVPGRQLRDNVIVLQKVVPSKSGSNGWMILKIDLEKAYDRLRWSFIEDSLRLAGFPEPWISIIMKCLEACSMRVLWNGIPSESFHPSRGIRQGDPISPYLFVLAMERLGHCISQAVSDKCWRPISIPRQAPAISHLFFADELLLFAKASVDQIAVVNQCLQQFDNLSGQRVNMAKSKIFFSANVDMPLRTHICSTAGISLTEDIGVYLGVPIFNGRVTKSAFDSMLSQIDAHLAGWKVQYLSLAGHVTLARPVLIALPNHVMQSVYIPRVVSDEFDKWVRNFVLGGPSGEKNSSFSKLESGNTPC
ncbi:hypothetical protein JCGZ_02692 [Jatropha curcas]|uniref:Reverse transcriptase domain-containing protein n=1 Tax=Jatropha curcas TaxID=180498 RepID=A0A067KU52_JATCU|nr:hypothetical protein JCGZ_02692 [Jatropha curcas]